MRTWLFTAVHSTYNTSCYEWHGYWLYCTNWFWIDFVVFFSFWNFICVLFVRFNLFAQHCWNYRNLAKNGSFSSHIQTLYFIICLNLTILMFSIILLWIYMYIFDDNAVTHQTCHKMRDRQRVQMCNSNTKLVWIIDEKPLRMRWRARRQKC